MTILFGLLAAVAYGSADFCGGLATKRANLWAVAILSQVGGFIILLLCFPLYATHAPASSYFWGALAGLCGGVGVALLYHALSIGKMGVVSPVTAVLAAATPVLVQTFSGERIALLQWLGITAALAAVVLVSVSFERPGVREFATSGLREAVASGIILGGFYIFLARAGNSGLQPLIGARAASSLCLILIALFMRAPVRVQKSVMPLVIACAVLDVAANVLYVLSTRSGLVSISAVLTSLYPAATVVLAALALRERLNAVQYAGLGLALCGVTLIAL